MQFLLLQYAERRSAFHLFAEPPQFELGKSNELRAGSDLTIIACGRMMTEAVDAAETLQGTGVSARVLNFSSVKPIDREAIVRAATETGAIVTAEEHFVAGGLGSAVAEVVIEEHPVPMRIVGVRDRFGRSGKPAELLKLTGLTAENIVRSAEEVLKQKKRLTS